MEFLGLKEQVVLLQALFILFHTGLVFMLLVVEMEKLQHH